MQTYYELPLRKPLNMLHEKLLRGAVNVTLNDGGTPFDAATRFYAALVETSVREGKSLSELNFGLVLGRLFALRAKFRHFNEHISTLKRLRADD